MILRLKKILQESFCLIMLNKEDRKFEKHTFPNMVAMETSSDMDCYMSHQIVAR